MPYEITVNLEQGFAHLVYSGMVDLAQRISAREEVFRLVKEHGLCRSLVDTSGSDLRLTMPEVLKFANSFRELGIPRGYHVACVIAPHDQLSSMLEVAASTDGLNIRVFIREADAIAWLQAF